MRSMQLMFFCDVNVLMFSDVFLVLFVGIKVELHREVEVSVKVLDGNDLPIDSSYFSLMDVKPVSRSDIISVRSDAERVAYWDQLCH